MVNPPGGGEAGIIVESELTLLERERELSILEDRLHEARGRRGQAVLIEAPAGLGKTSLLRAAGDSARDAGFLCLTARATELERDFAYGCVRQLLEPVVARASEAERDAAFEGAAAFARPLFSAPGGPADSGLRGQRVRDASRSLLADGQSRRGATPGPAGRRSPVGRSRDAAVPQLPRAAAGWPAAGAGGRRAAGGDRGRRAASPGRRSGDDHPASATAESRGHRQAVRGRARPGGGPRVRGGMSRRHRRQSLLRRGAGTRGEPARARARCGGLGPGQGHRSRGGGPRSPAAPDRQSGGQSPRPRPGGDGRRREPRRDRRAGGARRARTPPRPPTRWRRCPSSSDRSRSSSHTRW